MSCPLLRKSSSTPFDGPLVLAIMDGIGVGPDDKGNAVAQARTPNLDWLKEHALYAQLSAHGKAVGLPSNSDMGNSEVGHNALGAGRIFDQGAKLVSTAIDSERLFQGNVWRELIRHCVKNRTPLHFLGLLSDGNVHSHIDHLMGLLAQADEEGIQRAFIHALLDGRDVPKMSAHEYVEKLESFLASINTKPNRTYRIASGGGRMTTTMDRYESDWRIVERGWHAHVLGRARQFPSTMKALETFRQEQPGITDQELPAFVIAEHDDPIGTIEDGSAVIAFNFRGDRMLELVQAFEDKAFDKFDRVRFPNILFTGMMQYDGDRERPKKFLVEPPLLTCTLSELLCEVGIKQFACSETQKFGHVTYFWNGNRSGKFDQGLEDYLEIPSHAPPFDGKPAMRANEITDAVTTALKQNQYDFLRLNFPNGDMVGHTGNLRATIEGVEAVDTAMGQLQKAVTLANGTLMVTADHGNADDMLERNKKTKQLLLDEQGEPIPKTSHSLNPVPFYLLVPESNRKHVTLTNVENAGLGNVAATMALLLGFEPPTDYLPALITVHG